MNFKSRTSGKPPCDRSQLGEAFLDLFDQMQATFSAQPTGGVSDAHPTDPADGGTPPSPLLTVSEAAQILKRTEAAVRHMIFQAEAYSQIGGNARAGGFLECIARPPQTRRVFLHRERLLALVESWASPKTLDQ